MPVLLDLVFARRCLGCGRPGFGLCPRCTRPRDIARVLPGVGVVRAAADYDAAVRRAVIRYKERDRRDLAGPLGALLARAIAQVAPSGCPVLLVPVPSSRAAMRARGGDHLSRLIAASRTPYPQERLLRVGRGLADTAGLGRSERQSNLAGAFTAVSPDARSGATAQRRTPAPGQVARRRVVLIDDVVTTGASLQEAARALVAAGWLVAGAAVVAATPRKRK